MSEEAIIAAGMFTGFCAGVAHGHWIDKLDYKQAGVCAIGAVPVLALSPGHIGVYAGGLVLALAGRLLGCAMRRERLDKEKERTKLYELAAISLEEHDEYVMGTLLNKLKRLKGKEVDEWNDLLNTTRFFGKVHGSLDEVLESLEPVVLKAYLQENEETDGALYILDQDVVTRDTLAVENARIIARDDNPVKRLEMLAQVRKNSEFTLDKYALADLIHKEKGIAIVVSGSELYDIKHEAGVQVYARLAGMRLCGMDGRRDAA